VVESGELEADEERQHTMEIVGRGGPVDEGEPKTERQPTALSTPSVPKRRPKKTQEKTPLEEKQKEAAAEKGAQSAVDMDSDEEWDETAGQEADEGVVVSETVLMPTLMMDEEEVLDQFAQLRDPDDERRLRLITAPAEGNTPLPTFRNNTIMGLAFPNLFAGHEVDLPPRLHFSGKRERVREWEFGLYWSEKVVYSFRVHQVAPDARGPAVPAGLSLPVLPNEAQSTGYGNQSNQVGPFIVLNGNWQLD
jgi:hypothetical protein